MKKIVSVIKPFVVNQNVFVYEDGNKIDVISANLEDIENSLIEIAEKYNVIDIELIGSKNYSKGIKNKIETAEMTKYNTNKLNIKLTNS